MLNINHETSNGSVQVESCNEKYDRFIFILKSYSYSFSTIWRLIYLSVTAYNVVKNMKDNKIIYELSSKTKYDTFVKTQKTH